MRRARLDDRLHVAAERSGHSQVIEPAQPFRACGRGGQHGLRHVLT